MIADQISGWMRPRELEWLAERAADCQIIVEIGTWKGRSTAALAEHTNGVVYTIDHFGGSPDLHATRMKECVETPGSVEAAARRNLAEFVAAGKVVIIAEDSRLGVCVLLDLLGGRFADMVFIDGDHTRQAVEDDIRRYAPFLRPGGMLCGHDRDEWGVQDALRECGITYEETPGTTIWHCLCPTTTPFSSMFQSVAELG